MSDKSMMVIGGLMFGFLAGFIVSEKLERNRGLIACTGYQKARIEHITVDGANLFVGSRTMQQIGNDIAGAVCRDTGI